MDERRIDGFRFRYDVVMTNYWLYQYLNDELWIWRWSVLSFGDSFG